MDIDPHVVGIEITESVFASNYDYVNKVIAQLRMPAVMWLLMILGLDIPR